MNVKLPSEQQKWLEEQVAAGYFQSLDDALALAVADLMAFHADDLDWAKPYVDQAHESIARGDVVSGEDYLKRLDGTLERFRSR